MIRNFLSKTENGTSEDICICTAFTVKYLVGLFVTLRIETMAELSYTGFDKDQYVISLAALICADSKVDITAENLNAVVSSSGNTIAPYWAPLFAATLEKAGGVSKFFSAPGAGGAAPGNLI
jgi:hypothetical protein